MIVRLTVTGLVLLLLAGAVRVVEVALFGFDPGVAAHWASLHDAWGDGRLVIDRLDKIALILSWPLFAALLIAGPLVAWRLTAGVAGLDRRPAAPPPAPAEEDDPQPEIVPVDDTLSREQEAVLARSMANLAEYAKLEAYAEDDCPSPKPPADGHAVGTASADQRPDPAVCGGPAGGHPTGVADSASGGPALAAAVHARLLMLGYREAQAVRVAVMTEDGTEHIDAVTAADGVVTALIIWARPDAFLADETRGIWCRPGAPGECPSPVHRARRLAIALQAWLEPLLATPVLFRAAVVVAGGVVTNAEAAAGDWRDLGVEVCGLSARPGLPPLESVLGSCLTPLPAVIQRLASR